MNAGSSVEIVTVGSVGKGVGVVETWSLTPVEGPLMPSDITSVLVDSAAGVVVGTSAVDI